jgi:hypothetical protein
MKKPRKGAGWLWAGSLAFAAGYLATTLARHTSLAPRAPVAGTAAVVAVTIPFAAVLRRALRGGLRGLAMGLTGSFGIILALYEPTRPLSAAALSVDTTITAVTTMICCTATGAVFAVLAERRYRQLYGDDAPGRE